MRDPDTYSGNFYLLVEPITSAAKLTNPATLTRTGGVPNEQLFALDYPTNLAFLRSPGMTLSIAKEIKAKNPTVSLPAIWSDLRENLIVERLGNTRATATKIFAVTFKGEDPDLVQSILETAAETYLKYSAEDRQTNIKAGIEFIDKQIPDLQKRLEDLQSQQQKLRQQYDLINPIAKSKELLTQVGELGSQQIAIQTQLQELKALYTTLQGQLNLTSDQALVAATLSQNPERQALLSQLQQTDSQIAAALARFTPNNPNLQDLEEQRQNLLNLLAQKTQEILKYSSISVPNNSPVLSFQDSTRLGMIQQLVDTANQIEVLEVRQKSLVGNKAIIEQKAKQFPDIIRQYNETERQIALTIQILDRLLIQQETLKLEGAQELPWQLISKPQIPIDKDGKPISSAPDRKKKVLAGFMGGLLLSAGAAIMLEKRRDMFYTPDDIKDACSMPLLGDIPVNVPSQPLSTETKEPDVPVEPKNDEQSDSLFLDAFDKLYAKLRFLYSETPIRSLVVSSVESEDGQSTVALNLAKTAAAKDQRVLLVDANLEKPYLHTCLKLPNYKGLRELIAADKVSPDEIIQQSPDQEIFFF